MIFMFHLRLEIDHNIKAFAPSSCHQNLFHSPPHFTIHALWRLINIVLSLGYSSVLSFIMPASILTPYDDSMRLGQGYNSFLHIPCVHDAIKIGQGDVTITKPNNTSPPISQAVNYSSRFVDKISEVAKSMNVSAGSSIKNGSIISSGSTLSFDEGKFASSHLNAIVSVKVINQTVELVDTVSFVPMKDIKFSTEKFLKIYGNCYISGKFPSISLSIKYKSLLIIKWGHLGFIEGGDFTGILSARILEAAHRKEVEKQYEINLVTILMLSQSNFRSQDKRSSQQSGN